MMQNRKKYILVTGSIIILVLIFLFRSVVWGEYLQTKLNEQIALSGWRMDVGTSSGHLFGTTHLNDVTLGHTSGSLILIDKTSVNFGVLSSIFSTPVLDLISVEGMNAQLSGDIYQSNSTQKNNSLLNIPYHIRSFFVDGKITTNIKGKKYTVNLMAGGGLTGMETPSLNFDLLKISMADKSNLSCHFHNLVLGHDGSVYFLRDVKGDFLDLPIMGNIAFDQPNSRLTGTIDVMNFSFPEELFSTLPLQTKFSTFTGKFNFESDLNYFNGKLILENELGLDMKGQFSVGKEKTAWVVKNLELTGERSRLTLNGLWEEGERISCYMNLDNLDLGRWMKNQNPTQMSGLFILDGGLTNSGSLDQIDMTLEMVESKLFNQGDVSIHGQLSYKDSIIATIDPVMLMVGDSYLTLDGQGNFASNTVDFLMDLEKADIELVNSFLPGDFISGKATGKLKVHGNIHSPSATAELICENVKVSDFHLQSIELNSQITVTDTIPSGFVDIKAGKGRWKDRSFESGTVNATLKNKSVVIENCHFKSGDDFLQASGTFDGLDQYKIDRVQLAYQSNYLVNSRPLLFSIQDSILQVDPFEFHINDGMMEGVITGGSNPEGRFKMSNFDAEILTQFLKDERLKFSGLIFGEIWIQSTGNELDLDADLSLKRGMYMSEPFDEMVLSCLYKNGMLHLDDISMTREGSMGLQANGIIPFRQSQTGHSSISLKSSFSNLSMEFIHRFIPKFFTLKGSTSGFLHLKGTPEKTQFKYDLEINESLFDVIALGHFTSKGKYDGRKLFVESAKSIRDDGTITAYGSVPFDLNIGSSEFGQFFNHDSINFHAQAQLGSLPFLSPYLSDLDSARGNFDISLSLTGPAEQIQRSGYVNIKNGKLYTLLISDPITAIDGAATMKNNQLVIQDLIAMLYHPNGKYPKPRKQNVTIMGSVDFSKFFNPGYNLRIKGKEASYRLLALDISGQSNLNVTISGKDTVSIAGTIETQDANVFYEFTTEDVGTALPEESEIVMSYNLNIPIRGTALFQNSQIDAQVTGELSLTQMGYQEIDFGGQIIVEDGSVFSYKDNFKELQGLVSFDNKGFNPFIDVNAYTMIDDERIDLRMMGGIDDLDIILESRSGFSESDILELLTWGKRFEDQKLTSTGFGNQTVSILGSLLENQLEKNFTSMGMMNYVDDINISGAAGLLQAAEEDFEFTANKQIGDKTFLNLSYKRSFSLNQEQHQIGVEYKLNRHFSVVGGFDKETGKLNLKYRYRYAY